MRGLFLLLLLLPGLGLAQDNRLKTLTFEHDGLERRYLAYVPRDVALLPGPRPLVMVLHGGGGTARQIARGTRNRFEQLADIHGFYVVYPDAIDKSWDTGGGVVSEAMEQRRDDLGFLEAVIERMAAAHPIDRSRVFATGISRGGQASFLLACRSEKVRAIAPVAMVLPSHLAQRCHAGAPVGMMLIMGTEDPLVPIDGGRIRIFRQIRDQVDSDWRTLATFLRRNGCSGPPDMAVIDRVEDGTSIERSIWPCQRAPVAYYKIIGGGHTWPSERSILPERLVGRTSSDIVAADEIWDFFAQYR